MEKKILNPVFQLTALTFFFTLLLASCKKQTVPNIANDDAGTVQQKGKPAPGHTVTYLSLTVNDPGNKITSDNLGIYANGSQAVSAKFDQYGNFIFSCGKEGRGPGATYTRKLNVNFDSPIVVYIPPPIEGNTNAQGISTQTPLIALQELPESQSQCVGLTLGTSGSGWVVNFHRDTENVSSSISAYAVFTRTGPNTWVVTPAGECSDHSNVCALRNGPGTLYGYYNMPFSFTLTKIP